MKFELNLVRGGERPDVPRIKPVSATPMRKQLNETVATAVREALQNASLLPVAEGLSRVMLVVAAIVDMFDAEPDIADFVVAAMRSIDNAQSILDRGLMIHNWEEVRQGSVMMEIAVRGVCAALGIPYNSVLEAVWTGGSVHEILKQHGLVKGEQHGVEQAAADGTSGGDSGESLSGGDHTAG